MSVDKHQLQQWVAGAEVRFKKTRKPFSGLPLINRIEKLAERTQSYHLVEKIDLTRAKDFSVQDTSEDFLIASIELPIFGKRGVGNDTGMAIATFQYTDGDGDEHRIIALCAYTITGVVTKTRQLKQVITVPMV